jgi:hypothetical protein
MDKKRLAKIEIGKWILTVTVLLLFATVARSQTERGSIRGTIFDQTGAIVANAAITATNVATGVSMTTRSSDSGSYNVPALPSGTYKMAVQMSGFKNLVRDNVVVAAAVVIGLDLNLEVGNSAETVNVTAEAPLLRTETSSTSTEVDSKQYVDLPITASGAGRRSQAFLLLVPGYSGTPGGFTDSINGAQTSTKEMQIDGVSMIIGEIGGDGRNVTMPPESVQELSVATSAYTAEYGNTGGGVERYVLKSGSNDFHGAAYEFVRNTVLDARGFFNTVRPGHKENEFGFAVGGPVLIPKLYSGRNKTFFFFSYNRYIYRTDSTTTILSVPNDAFRVGDLSGISQRIYDPATTRQLADGSFTRDPFGNNIIPQNRISAVAKNYLNVMPRSTTQSVFQNYFAQDVPRPIDRTTFTTKGDHYFNGAHHLTVSDVYTNNPQTTISGFALPQPVGGLQLTRYTFHFARATHDWTMGPTMLNQFRLGFNRQTQYMDTPQRSAAWPSKLGIRGLELGSGSFPNINVGTFTRTGNSNVYADRSSTSYLLSDALNWTKGAHNLKFGAELRDVNTYFKREGANGITFLRNETALPTAATVSSTGLEYASLLLGQVDNMTVPLYGSFAPHNTTWQIAFYAQDDFKVTPRLTINYGLRFDLFTPLAESHNYYGIMDPTRPNPAAGNLLGTYVFAGQNGLGNRLPPGDKNSANLGPRVGLAWKLSDKLVVRGGYGISYFQTGAYGGGNNTGLVDGYWITSSLQSLDSGTTPAWDWDTQFPRSALTIPPNISPALAVGTGVVVSNWDVSASRAAYSQNWNLAVQRQLAANWTLETAYVGSKGTRLPMRTDINQLDPRYYSLGGLLNADITSSAVVAAGYRPPYAGFKGTLAQALRPFPQFTNIGTGGKSSATIGNSTYHSLQVKLDKRFSRGLGVIVAYTHSKALTDAASNFVSNTTISRNFYNRRLDKTYSLNDRPNNLTFAFNYELPIGPGKPLLGYGGPAGKILGGWQISGILRYVSGAHIAVSALQSLPLMAATGTPQTANAVGGVSQMGSWDGKFDPSQDRYLNISAFAAPSAFTYGSTSLYTELLAPFYLNEDFSLIKKTALTEKVSLDIRLEAFNALNRTIFAAPASSVNTPQTFGTITSTANAARNAQLAVKLTF